MARASHDKRAHGALTGYHSIEVRRYTQGHYRAHAVQCHSYIVAQNRQEIRPPGRPYPMSRVKGISDVDQRGFCRLNAADPTVSVGGRQRSELNDALGLPPKLTQWALAFNSAEWTGTRAGWPYPADGDALRGRLAHQGEQVFDALSLDPSVVAEKFYHAASPIGQGCARWI